MLTVIFGNVDLVATNFLGMNEYNKGMKKMKLIDIAKKIDKSKENEDWVDTYLIGEQEFDIDVPYVEQDRLKAFWIGKWMCTDTYVGHRMYFFDDKPVTYSLKEGRKSYEMFYWFSLELAQEVKEYLLSLSEKVEDVNISIWDLNKDIGDNFGLHFNGQIVDTDKISLNGEKVELVERIRNEKFGIDTIQKIKLPNGEFKEVDVKELEFGFNLK